MNTSDVTLAKQSKTFRVAAGSMPRVTVDSRGGEGRLILDVDVELMTVEFGGLDSRFGADTPTTVQVQGMARQNGTGELYGYLTETLDLTGHYGDVYAAATGWVLDVVNTAKVK